ncbi:MAG: prephenate/arogenate dehydrogenase [Xenococcaceae cyanobacterium MO_188.B32]|nr:prephenate/arogenate dehydrogenase [Xenococcaceae cyanobacterium MO_188.B32]
MKIGIVGLGLIGGSLGLDLKTRGHEILGVSRQETTCQIALEKNIVDYASTDLSLLAAAEIVIVCTPIGSIASIVARLVPYLSPDTIVTDVGSVKEPIVEACTPLWSNFLGGHPMAGNTDRGIHAAQTDLFTGAAYVFTPTATTPPVAVEKLEAIARALGMMTYVCSPEVHDRAVAWISHLPVIISTNLITSCLQERDSQVLELAQKLASSGFRDTSRVGGGNPELGMMMAKYNRQALLRSLAQYRHSLDEIITQIERENWDNLERVLETNQQARPKFLN